MAGPNGNGTTEAIVSHPSRAPALALIDGRGEIVRLTDAFRAELAPQERPHVNIWDFVADPDQRLRLGRVLEGRLLRAEVALPSAGGSVTAHAEAVLDATATRHALLTASSPGPDLVRRAGTDALLEDLSLDESPAIIWIKDLAGRFLRVNRRYTERVGVENTRIAGKTDAELSPAHVIGGPRLVGDDGAGAQPAQLEYTVDAFADRQALTVLRFPVRDLDGIPVAVCGVAAPAARAGIARSEAERLLRIERWSRLTADAIRAELLEEWKLAAVAATEEEVAVADPPAVPTPGAPSAEAAAELARLREKLEAARGAAAELEQRLREELEAARGDAAEVERRLTAERARAATAARRACELETNATDLERTAALAAELEAERARTGQERSARADLERLLAEARSRAADAERAEAAAEAARVRAEDLTSALAAARGAETENRLALEGARAEIDELQEGLVRAREKARTAREALREEALQAQSLPDAAQPVSEEGASPPGPAWSHDAQRALTASLAGASEWRTGLKDVIRILGSGGGWDGVIAWCVDERRPVLRCAATWMAAPDRLGLFETDTWQRPQSVTASKIGGLAASGQAGWLTQLDAVEDAHLAAAASNGMRAAMLVPIRHGAQTVGVIELLTSAPPRPNPDLAAAMEAVALQLGHFEHLLRLGAEPRWRLGRL